jgi:hypothetical protein
MPFDYEGAKAAGYSDGEIATFLGQQANFDLDGAVKAGYKATDIIPVLVERLNARAPQQQIEDQPAQGDPMGTGFAETAQPPAPPEAGGGRGFVNPPIASKPQPKREVDRSRHVATEIPVTDAGGGLTGETQTIDTVYDPDEVGAPEATARATGRSLSSTGFAGTVLMSAPVVVAEAVANVFTGKSGDTKWVDAYHRNFTQAFTDAIDWYKLPPNAKTSTLAKIGDGLGSLVADLPLMIASGGLGAETKTLQTVPGTVEFLQQAVSRGFDAMRPIMVKAGTEKAQEVLDAGGTPAQAAKSALTVALTTGFQGAFPMSSEGKVLTRAATGFPVGAAQGEAARVIQNAADPASLRRDFDPENMVVAGATGAVAAAGMGHGGEGPRPTRTELGYGDRTELHQETARVEPVLQAGSVDEAIAAAQRAANPAPEGSIRSQMLAIRPLENANASREADVPAVAAGADRSGSVDSGTGVGAGAGGAAEPVRGVAEALGAARPADQPVLRTGSADAVGREPINRFGLTDTETQAALHEFQQKQRVEGRRALNVETENSRQPIQRGPADAAARPEAAGSDTTTFNVGGRDPHTVVYNRLPDGRLTRTITYPDGERSVNFLVTDKIGLEQWVSDATYAKGEFFPRQVTREEAAAAIQIDVADKQVIPPTEPAAAAPRAASKSVRDIALEQQRAAGWSHEWPFVPADLNARDFRDLIRNDPSIPAEVKQRIFEAGKKLGVVPASENASESSVRAEQPAAAPGKVEAANAAPPAESAGMPDLTPKERKALEGNPLRTFLMRQGVALRLAQDFAPGTKERLAMGRTFRKNGLEMDALAQRAAEQGFIPDAGDVNHLYDLISRAVSGERIGPMYGHDAELELRARMERQRAMEETAHLEAKEALRQVPDEALEDDVPWDNVGRDISEAEAMRLMGFTEEEIAHATAERPEGTPSGGESRAQPHEVAAEEKGGSDRSGEDTARGQEEGLTRPSAADVVEQQRRREEGERAEAQRRADEESRSRADAELPDFKLTGSDRAADENPDQTPLFRADSTVDDIFRSRAGEAADRLRSQPRRGMSRQDFEASVRKAYGNDVGRALLKKRIIEPVSDESKIPEHVLPFVGEDKRVYGFHDPVTDRTYAVLRNLEPKMVQGLVLHEVGVHYGFEAMVGRKKFAQVMERIKIMGRAGNKAVLEALDRAKSKAAAASQVPEETLAYLVQYHPEMGVVREVIAKIKAFLYNRFGIGGSKLTVDDITMLARGAVGHAARENPASRAKDFAADVPRFSVADEAADADEARVNGAKPMPKIPYGGPGAKLVAVGKDIVGRLLHDALFKTAPMATGSDQARAIAKDYANAERKARAQWSQMDEVLKKNFDEAERREMWEAADDENVQRMREAQEPQYQRPKDSGLDRLNAKQREAVETLHDYGEQLLQRAKDVGMFQGEGLPYWTPRMAVMIGAEGEFAKIPGEGQQATSEGRGRNVTTSSPNLKQRKYLTAAETEAAANALAKSKGGAGAQLVRDIRTMPLAMARLERAIAGRELVNQIKELGLATGMPVVSDSQRPGFFTLDHPAFKTMVPKRVPVRISEYFDRKLMDGLMQVAENIGVEHERLGSLRGGALGLAYRNKPLVQTKFFTPDQVLTHELGHQLDYKYGLAEQLVKRGVTAKELRALADLRFEGQEDEVSDNYKLYVRKGTEKIANLVHAYVHNPERFREVAPKAFDWFDKFVEKTPELEPLRTLGPSLTLGKRDVEAKVTQWESRPLFVAKDFEGPLKAVLSEQSGDLYKFFMDLKAKSMGLIMYSPLIHNAVEWGRALPVMPGKILTFRIYFEGNKVKNDWAQMQQAIEDGLVPIGARGGMQDITGLAEEPNLAPGRSWTAKLLGGAIGAVHEGAGVAVKKGVDAAGDFWHNTLLWDRVGDLQAGLYSNVKADLIRKGHDEQTAGRLAAHFANRYAGALPNESMSANARKVANFVLFSRSFTLGNLGVMKDMVSGFPKDLQAQILRDAGDLALRAGKSVARRKAIAAFMLDIALLYVGNSLLQSALDKLKRDKSLDEILHGYAERFDELVKRTKEHPLEVMTSPLESLRSLTPMSRNEPGKEDRILYDTDKNGTNIYLRLPTGKIGEEFKDWLSSPLEMLKRKQGTIMRPLTQLMTNDKGFGQRVYNPDDKSWAGMAKNAGRIAALFLSQQVPVDSIRAGVDWASDHGEDVDRLKVVGPLAGVTFSKGAPGGPEVGEMYHENRVHQGEVADIMPDVKRALKAGDEEAATRLMEEAKMTPQEINRIIKREQNPASRISPSRLREFNRRADDEQKKRMEDYGR